MTEQNNVNVSQNQNTGTASTPTTVPPVTAKYTDDDVDRIVGTKVQKGYDKGYETAKAEIEARYAPPTQPSYQQPSPQPTQQVGGINQLTPDQVRQMIAEESQKKDNANYYNSLANSFVSKLNAGSKKYEDFDAVVTPLNLPQIPEIWTVAEKFDNPADILYELGNNPAKLAQLRNIAYSPELVKREMQKLSDSLKQNEEADQQKTASPPLSRPKPSNVGMGNGGSKDLSVADYRKIYRR